ncbi:MAG: hypothetical protein WCL08_02080 [Verrucomicrobiota bacterium]
MFKVSKARLCLIVILLVGATITFIRQSGGSGDAAHASQPKAEAEGKACCDAPVSRAGYFKEAAAEAAK